MEEQKRPTIFFAADEPELEYLTHKFAIERNEGCLTVGVNIDRQVREIHVSSGRKGSPLSGWAEGFSKIATLALQHGVPLQAIVAELKNMRFEPRGRTDNKDVPIARSPLDYIAQWLEAKFLRQ